MSIHNLCLISASVLVLTNAANATGPKIDLAPELNNSAHTYTQQLKPISQLEKAYQIAKIQFLPDAGDDLGFSGSNGIGQDHNSGNSCGDFPLTSCPTGGICGRCSFGAFYKLNNCKSGFLRSGNSCTPASCSSINASYQATVPANKICTKITANGLTCFKDCRAVSCTGYTLNCDAFNVANSASKDTCPDCNSADANCSPKLCKVGTCQDGYKLAENATQCIALDDTCSNGYFKTCETGTMGEPQYTEKGTACYQCKPKPTGAPILYSDLTTSPEIISGKTPIGVVFDENKKRAVALNESKQYWSTETFDIPNLPNIENNDDYIAAENDWNGKNNTKTIIDYCKANTKSCPAAEYAYGYSTAGTQPGNWYLPAKGELNAINENILALDAMMAKIGGSLLTENNTWSSSEHNKYDAKSLFLRNNSVTVSSTSKSVNRLSVRPVINYGDMAPVCSVANCKTCVTGSDDQCKTCNSGYTLSSGQCVPQKRYYDVHISEFSVYDLTPEKSVTTCRTGPFTTVKRKTSGSYLPSSQGECKDNCAYNGNRITCRLWNFQVEEGTILELYSDRTVVNVFVNGTDIYSIYPSRSITINQNTEVEIRYYIDVN